MLVMYFALFSSSDRPFCARNETTCSNNTRLNKNNTQQPLDSRMLGNITVRLKAGIVHNTWDRGQLSLSGLDLTVTNKLQTLC